MTVKNIIEQLPDSINFSTAITSNLTCVDHTVSEFGFDKNFFDSKYINVVRDVIRADIKDVEIIVPNKVVQVTFADGKKEKAICQEPDVFELEEAIGLCIAKYLCGGSSRYYKNIRSGIKVYKNKIKKEEEENALKELIKRKREKRLEYKKRKEEKKKKESIDIQTEAYIKAVKKLKSEGLM